ncbi:MAG: threonylcarbamoyl-AMP synthase [Saprospiraceae bacterium]|nr:threonylcarbamoyl-AMP synthase [Saprospiraceae bacterium]
MIGNDINLAAKLLINGDVIGIPTETVYGLAGNALNEETVLRIFQIKQRPHFDPLIIHVKDVSEISKYSEEFPDELRHLASLFMPGPLTLLLRKKNNIPDLVTSGSDFVAIRIPAHDVTLQLLQKLEFPLAAPSANPFGYISPTTAQHVADQLGDKIPYILDGGACQIGIESTIIGIENGSITIYRKGGLSIKDIQDNVKSRVVVKDISTSNPAAPGMLLSHYAPRVPLYLDVNHKPKNIDLERCGYIRFKEKLADVSENTQIILSENGDYKEAARKLFAGMRLLDKMDIDYIIAELLPEEDIGIAINDRLRRAATS